jgi:hypothetical protein
MTPRFFHARRIEFTNCGAMILSEKDTGAGVTGALKPEQ